MHKFSISALCSYLPLLLLSLFVVCWTYLMQADYYAHLWFRLTGRATYVPWLATVLLTVSIGIVYVCLLRPALQRIAMPLSPLRRELVTVLGIMLCVGACGDTDEAHHLSLSTARLCAEGRYDEALALGQNYQVATPALTALRTRCLTQLPSSSTSRYTALPERLFAYPLTRERDLYLSTADSLQLLPYSAHLPRITAQGQRDIYLMKRLVRRDLKGFVRYFMLSHTTDEPDLPRSYAEALLLYSRLYPEALQYAESAIQANYRDFREMEKRGVSDISANAGRLFAQYGDTYWWYYYYGKH